MVAVNETASRDEKFSSDLNLSWRDRPLQVIGAGPAGIGLVLALCNRIAAVGERRIPERDLLESLIVFEAGERPGGNMDRYRVNANTSSHDVVQGIADGTPFVAVRDAYLAHPDTQDELIPLPRIGELMVEPLARALTDFLGSRLRCGVAVARIEITPHGFTSFGADGEVLATSRNLMLCCGARDEPLPALLPYRDRWEGSARFLMRNSLDGLPTGNGPVVIVGASHSAFSCAWRLLYDPLFADFAAGRDILLLQRRARIKLRGTPEFAAAHRIAYDPVADVCPDTGLVFRNGGLRKDAKQLYLDIRDGRENRVRLEQIRDIADCGETLARAGLILQATNFAPRLPRIERDGVALSLGRPTRDGELHDLDTGRIVAGLYGMGLGLNILPGDAPRGEPSFGGGIHGFQSYPLAVAPRVIDRIVENLQREASHEN